LGILSCKKEISYDFRVVNKTNYNLSVVSFDWCHNDNKITIGPNDSTDLFTLSHELSWANAVATGSLCITVENYSDSISTYTNDIGVSIERTELNKKKINHLNIIIDPEPYDETDIFNVTLD
jgi:hypothetical protein